MNQEHDAYNYADDVRPEHRVRVRWAKDEICDAVKADTPDQATEAAWDNWPDAITITLLPQQA